MKQILYKLFEHQYLGRDEARTILQNIAQGKYNDVQVASLITVFLMRIYIFYMAACCFCHILVSVKGWHGNHNIPGLKCMHNRQKKF